MQFTENGNQFDGKVIHAVKAQIFKSLEDSAFSGAAKAGEDHQLAVNRDGSAVSPARESNL